MPVACLACQRRIDRPADNALGLCAACHSGLILWPESICHSCGSFLQTADPPPGFQCGACRHSTPPFERLLSRFSYQAPIESVILGLKFRRLDYLGRQLGEDLLQTLRREHEFGRIDLSAIDRVTAVPLHGLRHLQRGYNQAWLVAKPIADALNKPLVRLLARHQFTTPQRGLTRDERLTNLRRAFRTRQRTRVRDQTILLIDDVVTTGATLRAAASCLRQAGARSVIALTVARTPDDKEAPWLVSQKDNIFWQK